jgi:hypothetical protein
MGNVGRINDPPVFPLDCDDTNSSVKPGAVEVCNGIDDNCDGDIDEFVQKRIYEDLDGDGYGSQQSQLACLIGDTLERLSAELAVQAAATAHSKGAKYVLTSGDCNDSDPDVNPKTGYRCK